MTKPVDQALTPVELQTLEALLSRLSGKGADLPAPLFRFLTEISATVNVDLLVRDDEKGVLLAWRDDPFGTGWHVPGSIIRHREEISHRISSCARDEFGCEAEAAKKPVAIIQTFDDRGHSISLCYPTILRGSPSRRVLRESEEPEPGDLCWFLAPPARLYPSHLVYRDVLVALERGQLGEGARLFTQHAGRRDAEQASSEGTIGSGPLT